MASSTERYKAPSTTSLAFVVPQRKAQGYAEDGWTGSEKQPPKSLAAGKNRKSVQEKDPHGASAPIPTSHHPLTRRYPTWTTLLPIHVPVSAAPGPES